MQILIILPGYNGAIAKTLPFIHYHHHPPPPHLDSTKPKTANNDHKKGRNTLYFSRKILGLCNFPPPPPLFGASRCSGNQALIPETSSGKSRFSVRAAMPGEQQTPVEVPSFSFSTDLSSSISTYIFLYLPIHPRVPKTSIKRCFVTCRASAHFPPPPPSFP